MKCGEGTGNQIKSDMVFRGTGALGRLRAGAEDREVQGWGHETFKGMRELATCYIAQELPGHRAQEELLPHGRSSSFKAHWEPASWEHVTWGQITGN